MNNAKGAQSSLNFVSYFENTKQLYRVSSIYYVPETYGHLLYAAKLDISTGIEFVTHYLEFGYSRFLKMKIEQDSER